MSQLLKKKKIYIYIYIYKIIIIMSQYYLLGSSRQDKVNKPFKILHLTRPILAMIMNICILKSYMHYITVC